MREAEQAQHGEQGQGQGQQPHGVDAGTPATSEVLDLGRVRELILQAHPAVVPELVQGETFDALIASVGQAEAAYARIRESVAGQQSGQPPAVPSVLAGQPGRTFVINVEELSPAAKIAEGLKRAKSRS